MVIEDLNSHFVHLFAELNIQVKNDGIHTWMNLDGPGYQHMNDQEIVNMVTVCESE